MALFFVFGRTNYSRWGPIELQDSLDLQRKFPSLHAHLEKGGFVMYMSTKQGSAIAFDMGLKKGYNKPAQTVHGIIGYTRRSEAVALWNVLKHEKDAYVRNLKEMCHLTDHDDEFLLHHEFNQKSARRSHERVCLLKKYNILTIRKPFNQNKQFCNLVTKVEIHQSTTEKLLDCMSFGDDGYVNYVQSRLVDKDTPLQGQVFSTTSCFHHCSSHHCFFHHCSFHHCSFHHWFFPPLVDLLPNYPNQISHTVISCIMNLACEWYLISPYILEMCSVC